MCDSIFAVARRDRLITPLNNLEPEVVNFIAPEEIELRQEEFVELPFGYARREAADKVRKEGASILLGSKDFVLREWRRKTRLERLFLPRVDCFQCGHPMNANLNGRNGYACPDCGFTLFGSLLYACDCGQPILVLGHPPVEGLQMYATALSRIRDEKLCCQKCRRAADPRLVPSRVFFAPVPWPLNVSPDAILIAHRSAPSRPKGRMGVDETSSWLSSEGIDAWLSRLPAAEKSVAGELLMYGTGKAVALLVVVGLILTNLF